MSAMKKNTRSQVCIMPRSASTLFKSIFNSTLEHSLSMGRQRTCPIYYTSQLEDFLEGTHPIANSDV